MAGSDDTDDRKVKDLLDPATRADLERWFTLPSYEQLAERGVKPTEPVAIDDPELVELRRRRAAALEAVDPRLLAEHDARMITAGDMIKPLPPLEIQVDRSITSVDITKMDRQHTIAEPREYERNPTLEDDLKDCAPQALLRDLHRPELMFDKVFEIIDPGAEQRLDGMAVVAQMMATRWQQRSFATFAFAEARSALAELRAERRKPWAEIKIPNRTVTS